MGHTGDARTDDFTREDALGPQKSRKRRANVGRGGNCSLRHAYSKIPPQVG